VPKINLTNGELEMLSVLVDEMLEHVNGKRVPANEMQHVMTLAGLSFKLGATEPDKETVIDVEVQHGDVTFN
jgi:hypothetical protein